MPVGSIDDVVVSEEVLVVAGPPVWVGHHLVKNRYRNQSSHLPDTLIPQIPTLPYCLVSQKQI